MISHTSLKCVLFSPWSVRYLFLPLFEFSLIFNRLHCTFPFTWLWSSLIFAVGGKAVYIEEEDIQCQHGGNLEKHILRTLFSTDPRPRAET